jgi:hypothetical protein
VAVVARVEGLTRATPLVRGWGGRGGHGKERLGWQGRRGVGGRGMMDDPINIVC